MAKTPKSKCAMSQFGWGNHSDDIVQVFHGRTTPVALCGYHASEEWLKDCLAMLTPKSS